MAPFFRLVALLTVSLPLAFALVAQDAPRTPGSVGMLVAAEGIGPDLAGALSDRDARVRAAAARVINVRAFADLLPNLRDALRVEEDLDAAREQVRAVAMLGGPAEIGFLMEQAGRLGPSFRAEALVSVARVNSVETLSWYFARSEEKLLSLRDAGRFIRASHWGAPALLTATAARALSRKDETLWSAILDELEGPHYLSRPLGPIALKSTSPSIATETAWYLAALIVDKQDVPAAEILAALDETETQGPAASADLILGREVLARSLGRAPRNVDGPLRDLVRDGGVDRRGLCSSDSMLDQREKKIACAQDRKQRRFVSRFPRTSYDITPSPFYLVIDLPKGVAAGIVESTECRDDWVGNIRATVDRAGRVRSLSLEDVYTSAACKRALQHLIPLTIAENISIDSAFSTVGALTVKSRKEPLCVDEEPARREANIGMQPIGGDVKAPVVTRRVEPAWSAAALQRIVGANAHSLVIISSRVSETGCVAPLQVLRGSVESDLNRSALLALAQWKFTPGTLDGAAVPVIFNLTVNFKRQ